MDSNLDHKKDQRKISKKLQLVNREGEVKKKKKNFYFKKIFSFN